MSLIRNGGFERGNTDFWELVSGGSLEISNISPLYGTYCGKFTGDGSYNSVLLSKDYIDVKPYQIVDGVIYVKSASALSTYVIFYAYDSDYSLITTEAGVWVSHDGTWKKLTRQFVVPEGCAYVRFGVDFHHATSSDIFYVDGAGVEVFDTDSGMSGAIVLQEVIECTSSGNTWVNSRYMTQYTTYWGILYVDYVSGTSPTLDVDIRETSPLGNSSLVASFAQMTAQGEQKIDLPQCWGNGLYIDYTIGGTNPDFYFGVAVVGKR